MRSAVIILLALALGLAETRPAYAQSAPPADGPRCIPLQQRWDRGIKAQAVAGFRQEIVNGGLDRTCPNLLTRVDARIAEREQAAREQAAREKAKAQESAAWGIARRTDSIAAYQAYLADFPNGTNSLIARQRIAALTPKPPPPSISFLDARNTPSTTRAPLVSNPSSLPDFALFRECESCPEMVVIPAGSFLMGSPAKEAGRVEDEDDTSGPGGRQVNVRVPRFAISRFETTWEEWGACVADGGCQDHSQKTFAGYSEAGKAKYKGDAGYGRGARPVIHVDWNDAGMFARWVNAQIGEAAPSSQAVGGGGVAAPKRTQHPSVMPSAQRSEERCIHGPWIPPIASARRDDAKFWNVTALAARARNTCHRAEDRRLRCRLASASST